MSIRIRVKNPYIQTVKVAALTIAFFAVVGLASRFLEKPKTNTEQPAGVGWQLYFSPHGGCTEAILQQLESAKESIFVQAYAFTSEPIAKALADARKRGVRVSIILDKSQRSEQYSEAGFLAQSDIRTLVDDGHAIAHNKVMVIDGHTVITGSFNFTAAAEDKNAENLLVIHDTGLAQRYLENWMAHATHSQPYASK